MQHTGRNCEPARRHSVSGTVISDTRRTKMSKTHINIPLTRADLIRYPIRAISESRPPVRDRSASP